MERDVFITDSIREFCRFMNHAEQDIYVYRYRIFDSNRKLIALYEPNPNGYVARPN